MQDRERRGDALGRGQLLQHPEWLQLATPEGRLLYLHRLPPYVLSDNMYTGKCGPLGEPRAQSYSMVCSQESGGQCGGPQ